MMLRREKLSKFLVINWLKVTNERSLGYLRHLLVAQRIVQHMIATIIVPAVSNKIFVGSVEKHENLIISSVAKTINEHIRSWCHDIILSSDFLQRLVLKQSIDYISAPVSSIRLANVNDLMVTYL